MDKQDQGREIEAREMKLGDHPFLRSLTEWPRNYAGADPETVITVVAVAGYHDDWAAYYRSPWCPAERVPELGNKLPEDAATEIFPEWAKRLAWRP